MNPGDVAFVPVLLLRHAAFTGDQMILFDNLVEEFIGKIKKTEGKYCICPYWQRT